MALTIERFIPGHDVTWDEIASCMNEYILRDSRSGEIRDLVERITAGIDPDDHVSAMVAIKNWILGNLTYVKDAPEATRLFGDISQFGAERDLEMLKSPTAVLESGIYDCDCITIFICSLLTALGIQCRFTMVGFHPENLAGPDAFEHVYAEGYDANADRWVIIDPVAHPEEANMQDRTMQSKTYSI